MVFLIIDVFGHAWNSVGDVAQDTFSGKVSLGAGVPTVLALFSGLAIGLLGLVFYESRYMKKSVQQRPELEDSMVGGEGRGGGKSPHQQQVLQETNAYRLSMMIAIGIGAHNFSEGLAIGQSYVSGAIGLAVILIIGSSSQCHRRFWDSWSADRSSKEANHSFLNSCRFSRRWSYFHWYCCW